MYQFITFFFLKIENVNKAIKEVEGEEKKEAKEDADEERKDEEKLWNTIRNTNEEDKRITMRDDTDIEDKNGGKEIKEDIRDKQNEYDQERKSEANDEQDLNSVLEDLKIILKSWTRIAMSKISGFRITKTKNKKDLFSTKLRIHRMLEYLM